MRGQGGPSPAPGMPIVVDERMSERSVRGAEAERSAARLRIAMVAACPFPYPRGTPIRIFRMAEALALRGHDVHVVTYHLGEDVGETPVRVHRIPHVPAYRRVAPGPTYGKLLVLDPLLWQMLRRMLRQKHFDVIHAHHYEGLLVAHAARRRGGTPIVYDAHTLLGTELPYYRLGLGRGALGRIGAWLDQKLPGRVEHVVTVTRLLRDQLVESGAVPADRVTVAENGVEFNLFEGPPPPRSTEWKTVIFSGNLAPYQGVDHLLRAFQIVLRQRQDVRLSIVTEDASTSAEDLAQALGIRQHVDVVRIGFEGVPALLRAADVAVNPRVQCDGVPQKLMNYMAAGCPIVSFAGSAAHLRHGVTGWIVESADPAALANGVLHLLDTPELARDLGRAAREAARRDFSWERTAEKVENVYRRMLRTKHARG